MRVIRLLLIAALATGSLLFVAPAAGAVSKNCKALNSLDAQLKALDASAGKDLSQFKDVGDKFHAAAKQAKGKLKSALNSLGNTYGDISSLTDLAKLANVPNGKAFKTFITAEVKCA
jgi:hypothetical protein